MCQIAQSEEDYACETRNQSYQMNGFKFLTEENFVFNSSKYDTAL
jgi:hypothetical protein